MKLYYNPGSNTSRIVSFFFSDNDVAFDETIGTRGADDQNALAPYPNVLRWLKTLVARKGWAPAY